MLLDPLAMHCRGDSDARLGKRVLSKALSYWRLLNVSAAAPTGIFSFILHVSRDGAWPVGDQSRTSVGARSIIPQGHGASSSQRARSAINDSLGTQGGWPDVHLPCTDTKESWDLLRTRYSSAAVLGQ